MNKRWYDADPIITNAINLIQNSKDEKKNLMADFIIKEAKNLGVEPDIEVGQSNFDCFWHKRQDENAKYFMALEYLKAMEEVVKFIYDNIQYAEFNTKSDYCQCCGFDGEIVINEQYEWECPNCGNKDHSKMNVTRRTCGYLGENFWNVGKTKEIKSRVLHL